VWPGDVNEQMDFESAYSGPHDGLKTRTNLLENYGVPRVSVERIRLIHPTQHRLFLYAPPFLSSRQRT
jgi:hypothetical protein